MKETERQKRRSREEESQRGGEREFLTGTGKYSLLVKRTKSWTSLRSISSKFIGSDQARLKGHIYEFMNIVKAQYPAKLSFYVGSGQEFTCPSSLYGEPEHCRNYGEIIPTRKLSQGNTVDGCILVKLYFKPGKLVISICYYATTELFRRFAK